MTNPMEWTQEQWGVSSVLHDIKLKELRKASREPDNQFLREIVGHAEQQFGKQKNETSGSDIVENMFAHGYIDSEHLSHIQNKIVPIIDQKNSSSYIKGSFAG